MWYDILVLAILIYFAVRGAARGMVLQLAGIAGIVLCFAFADGISQFAGPYVTLEEPLNTWVILFGAYIFFTLIAYVIAGRISEYLVRVKLKEFDSHLGAVLGFVKGVILCLIMTFAIVTVSEDAREALRKSRSGIAAARIVKTGHSYLEVLPPNLVEALEKYIHLLDDDDLANHYAGEHAHHGHDHLPGTNISLGDSGTIDNGATPNPSQPGFDPVAELKNLVSQQTQQLLISAIQSESNPQTQNELASRLVENLKSASPQERSEFETLLQPFRNQGSQILLSRLSSFLNVPTTPKPVDPGLPVQPPTTPPQPNLKAEIASYTKQVAAVYSRDPVQQQNFETQISQFLGALPDEIYLGVLKDWNADIRSLPDPDRQTTGQSTLEQRIYRQAELANIPIWKLAPEIQDRLKAVSNPRSGSIR